MKEKEEKKTEYGLQRFAAENPMDDN